MTPLVTIIHFLPDTLSYEGDITALRLQLQCRLDDLLPPGTGDNQVCAAIREGTLAPGKRMRPLLLLLAARDMGCRQNHPGLIDLACSVEMIHAASLMLDDLPCMDNAQLRRGRPSIHFQFGQEVAILAAVALLSKAFGVVAAAEELTDPCRVQAVAALSGAVGLQGLVQGQFQDLFEGSGLRTPESIVSTNHLKTSMLFDATLQMAALVAEAPVSSHHWLRYFARDLGQAFQLLDDLADSYGGTGKDINQDKGKSTLVALLGPTEVRQRLHQHLHSADRHFSMVSAKGESTRYFMHNWFAQQLSVLSCQPGIAH